jgi:hypothetical protein
MFAAGTQTRTAGLLTAKRGGAVRQVIDKGTDLSRAVHDLGNSARRDEMFDHRPRSNQELFKAERV